MRENQGNFIKCQRRIKYGVPRILLSRNPVFSSRSIFQSFDFKNRFALDGQLPVGKQLITVDFDPRFNQFSFRSRQRSVKNTSVFNGEDGYLALVLSVEMGPVVLFIVGKTSE